MSTEGPSGDVPHSDLPGNQRSRLRDEGYLESESKIEGSDARENFALWIAVLGSAVIWFVQMQTSYSLVMWACSGGHRWSLHVASILFLILAAAPGWLAWKHWRASAQVVAGGADPGRHRETERESSGAGRRRFMAMLGLMLTALFILLIVAQAIPSFFFDPCLE